MFVCLRKCLRHDIHVFIYYLIRMWFDGANIISNVCFFHCCCCSLVCFLFRLNWWLVRFHWRHIHSAVITGSNQPESRNSLTFVLFLASSICYIGASFFTSPRFSFFFLIILFLIYLWCFFSFFSLLILRLFGAHNNCIRLRHFYFRLLISSQTDDVFRWQKRSS